MIEGIPLNHILIFSTLLFFIGVYGFLTRRNLITILISTELMLNAVNINFVVFNRYLYPDRLEGQFFSLFIIAIAAAEAAVRRSRESPPRRNPRAAPRRRRRSRCRPT